MSIHGGNPWDDKEVGALRDERPVYQCPTTGNIYWVEPIKRYLDPRDVDFKNCGKD